MRVSARRSQPWLGTLVEITATHCSAELAQPAISAGFAAVAKIHRLMSPRIAGSDVDRINRAALDDPVTVSAATWEVLALADDLHRRSEGLFDCAAGARDAPASQGGLELSREREVVKRSLLSLDLGGIAKGFAVDAALRALREAGADSGCVNAGGDIAAFGERACPVDVRDPIGGGMRHRLVELRDFAVATSSIEECNALQTGTHARHVDRKAFDSGATICVLAARCVVADALTKIVALSGTASHPLLASLGASAIVLAPRDA